MDFVFFLGPSQDQVNLVAGMTSFVVVSCIIIFVIGMAFVIRIVRKKNPTPRGEYPWVTLDETSVPQSFSSVDQMANVSTSLTNPLVNPEAANTYSQGYVPSPDDNEYPPAYPGYPSEDIVSQNPGATVTIGNATTLSPENATSC